MLAAAIVVKWKQSRGIERLVENMNLPADCRQILLVTSASWNATDGQLILLQRAAGERQWHTVSEQPIPVSLGRSGLGWGRGLSLQPSSSGTQKREGDGRGVSGIFRLDTAFGYAPTPPENTRLPYRQATEHDYFVDDSSSPEYNQWVNLPPKSGIPQTRWKSAETMRRDDDKYQLGIVVEHNMHPAKPDMGSAIFLHVWGAPGMPTSGCTAMSRPDLEKIIKWLDPSHSPLLIQAPVHVLQTMRPVATAE